MILKTADDCDNWRLATMTMKITVINEDGDYYIEDGR